ncbi:MAG: hypothetical protein MZV65_13340 [Chromatiales bacterium]|nr:hypothetical protein [Chromatiales bacterium]
MTATPIPRTLAHGVLRRPRRVGDRRAAARTQAGARPWCCPTRAAPRWWRACDAACRDGRQAYWVCPLIEESEQLQARGRDRDRGGARRRRCRSCASALVHGRMKPAEKDAVMRAFKDGAARSCWSRPR